MRSYKNPPNKTPDKPPIWWHRNVIPEIVPRARRPYTSAVRVFVMVTVAIQENPANAAKSQSPRVDGTSSKAIYPQPLMR